LKFLFLFLFSQKCFCSLSCQTISLDYKKDKVKKISLKVRRYYNKNAPIVVISHAFCLNFFSLENLAIKLWEQGFDVWTPNMRGHGVGVNTSIVSPYSKGDYSFDNIVTEDLPFLVEKILSKTNKKNLSVIGHSIGGMIWKHYLAGVYKSGNKLQRSIKLAKERSNKVSRYIGICVPPHFDNFSPIVKETLMLIKPFIKGRDFFVPLRPAQWFFFEYYKSAYSFTGGNVYSFLSKFLERVLSEGVLEIKNIKAEDKFNSFVEDSLSSPHTDIVKDFLNWFSLYPAYSSKDRNILYTNSSNIFTATLMIAAGKDRLSRTEDIVEDLYTYNEKTSRVVYSYRDASHIDIIFNKYIRSLTDKIKKFINLGVVSNKIVHHINY
jgi:pimeloyl-ACP methyl ester carboxylesterase